MQYILIFVDFSESSHKSFLWRIVSLLSILMNSIMVHWSINLNLILKESQICTILILTIKDNKWSSLVQTYCNTGKLSKSFVCHLAIWDAIQWLRHCWEQKWKITKYLSFYSYFLQLASAMFSSNKIGLLMSFCENPKKYFILKDTNIDKMSSICIKILKDW